MSILGDMPILMIASAYGLIGITVATGIHLASLGKPRIGTWGNEQTSEYRGWRDSVVAPLFGLLFVVSAWPLILWWKRKERP